MTAVLRRNTIRWGQARFAYPIVGAAILAALATFPTLPACSSQRAGLRSYDVPTQPLVRPVDSTASDIPPRPPTTVETSEHDTSAAKQAAEAELGPKVAASMPVVEKPAPVITDPGANALVNSMLVDLRDRRVGDDGVTHIGTSQIRNQSKCAHAEYEQFQSRFVHLLSDAGRDDKVEFTSSADVVVQYQMQGTAYLITSEGFDQWEMFLSITSADRNQTLWEAGAPVHLLRQERPGVQQMFVPKH